MQAELAARGFVFVSASEMRARLGDVSDWSAFAASWNDLVVDPYVEGRYRKRRHARFVAEAGGVTRAPHGPHFQAKQYNPLYGDLERWFEPMTDEVGASQSLGSILAFSYAVFGQLAGRWNVEVHQFRIEARADQAGNP